jgi:hypothetical protein
MDQVPRIPLGQALEVEVYPSHSFPNLNPCANGNCTVSVIWNNAWQNRSLVHAHCFGEVHDGKSALFWKDTWEQLPILGGGDCFLTLMNSLGIARWEKLHHFWKTEPLSESTFMRT